jgi:hypothetical protein
VIPKAELRAGAARWGEETRRYMNSYIRREWGGPLNPLENIYQYAKTAFHLAILVLEYDDKE